MSKSENTIVITGAGGGIGLGLAEAFLREGYNVVGTGRSAQRLQAAADRLKAGERFLASRATSARPEPPATCSRRRSRATGRSTCW